MSQAFALPTESDSVGAIDFSDLRIGEHFLTDRWIWEKVDRENAKAMNSVSGNKGSLLGQVVHFRSWSQVRIMAGIKP